MPIMPDMRAFVSFLGESVIMFRTRFIPIMLLALCGCTSLSEYVHNGFKVGPNYQTAPAATAGDWIDAADKRGATAMTWASGGRSSTIRSSTA